MADPDEHVVLERGYGMGYQDSVHIETRVMFGMEPEEFYRRQVGLVLDKTPDSLIGDVGEVELRKLSLDYKFPDGETLGVKVKKSGMKLVDKCSLNLGQGSKVLDLAVGEGDTSRLLATTGAQVEARDIEKYLVETAKRRDVEIRKTGEVENVTKDVRAGIGKNLGVVNYALGDYGNVKDSLDSPEDNQFDAVTVLSRSFIYLGERKNYEKSLGDFNDLLKPGGKLVIQSREHVRTGDLPWSQEMGTSLIKNGDGDYVMADGRSGMSYAWRKEEDVTTLSDGVKQTTASRYLVYPDGRKVELGKVTWDDHLKMKYLSMWKEMLTKAGFVDVGLKVEGLSPDNTEIMFAIVARKKDEKEVAWGIHGVGKRLRRVFGGGKG